MRYRKLFLLLGLIVGLMLATSSGMPARLVAAQDLPTKLPIQQPTKSPVVPTEAPPTKAPIPPTDVPPTKTPWPTPLPTAEATAQMPAATEAAQSAAILSTPQPSATAITASGPAAPYLADEGVEKIICNGPKDIWIIHAELGKEKTPTQFRTGREVVNFVNRATRSGNSCRLDENGVVLRPNFFRGQ